MIRFKDTGRVYQRGERVNGVVLPDPAAMERLWSDERLAEFGLERFQFDSIGAMESENPLNRPLSRKQLHTVLRVNSVYELALSAIDALPMPQSAIQRASFENDSQFTRSGELMRIIEDSGLIASDDLDKVWLAGANIKE